MMQACCKQAQAGFRPWTQVSGTADPPLVPMDEPTAYKRNYYGAIDGQVSTAAPCER